MAGLISLWNSNGMGCDVVAMYLVEVVMCLGFYSVGLVMFVTCVVGRVLWWSCSIGKSGFGHLIAVFCIVHKCGFPLVVSMGSLGG